MLSVRGSGKFPVYWKFLILCWAWFVSRVNMIVWSQHNRRRYKYKYQHRVPRAGPAMPLLLFLLSGCLLCFPDTAVWAEPPLAAGCAAADVSWLMNVLPWCSARYIDLRAPDSLNSKAEADLANIKQKRRMFGFTPRSCHKSSSGSWPAANLKTPLIYVDTYIKL